MVPFWTGFATVAGAAAATTAGATLAASTTYYTQVTGSDGQKYYESQIYQVDGGTGTGAGGNKSLTLTVPATAGFLYTVYIGTNASNMANIAQTNSTAAPTTGPYAGMAAMIPPGTTLTLTGVGLQQVPPAAPATGVTVYPTFVFGRDYYATVKLDDLRMFFLESADKSDPLNQKRVVGWKKHYGIMFTNQQFGCRIESSSAFSATFG
jgi:hypothetical protein